MSPQTPPPPPTAAEARLLEENQRLLKESLPEADKRVQTSADNWSKGIGALFVLVGAGAWFGGPAIFTGTDQPWRWWMLGLALVGLALEVVALLLFLRVSAGTPKTLYARNFSATNTVSDHLADLRDRAARSITLARITGILGLVFFVAAFLVLVFAPTNTTKLSVTVSTPDGSATHCGVVEDSDNQLIRLNEAGEEHLTVIKFSEILGLKPVPAC